MPKQRRSTRKSQADQAEDCHAVKRRAGLKKEELRDCLKMFVDIRTDFVLNASFYLN